MCCNGASKHGVGSDLVECSVGRVVGPLEISGRGERAIGRAWEGAVGGINRIP